MAQRYSVGFMGGTPIQGYRGLSPELVLQPFLVGIASNRDAKGFLFICK